MDSNMDDFKEMVESVQDAFNKLLNSGLKEETIVLLLHDSSKVSKPAIREVLKAAKSLKQKYLAPGIKPTPKPSGGKRIVPEDSKDGSWITDVLAHHKTTHTGGR